jgi:hypothetical protein
MRVRTALVTARSAPAHERALNTLMDWKIDVDEAMFLGGLAKGGFCASSSPTSSSTTRPAMCAMRPDMFPRAMCAAALPMTRRRCLRKAWQSPASECKTLKVRRAGA